MVNIIILNWNGWKDTIECLQSLMSLKTEEILIVIGDNGSTNDSIYQIESFCKSKSFSYFYDTIDSRREITPNPMSVVICDLKQNYGFAKGNNLLIEYSRRFSPSGFLLLNNDTEVEPDFLEKLLSFKDSHSEFKVLTPLIHLFYEKSKIWNAGGKLLWGRRKYYYAGKPASSIWENGYISCTFVTGCALYFTDEVLKSDGKLFVENFFFGEEDFELSMRLKKEHFKIACVLDSVIYHKVGSATKKTTGNLQKNYIYYLNRYIDLRQHMNPIEFYLWRKLNNIYMGKLLLKKGYPVDEVNALIRRVNKEAYTMDGVSREYFESVLKMGK